MKLPLLERRIVIGPDAIGLRACLKNECGHNDKQLRS